MLTPQRIDELALGIEYHLGKLQELRTDLMGIKQSMDELRHAQERNYLWELEKLRSEFESMKIELQKRGLPLISQYEHEFRQIKELVVKDNWPRAVDPQTICVSEDAAFHRAQSILDLVVADSLKGRRFLDVGCGGGHVVMQAIRQEPKLAMGYDINLSQCKFNNDHFTSEFDLVTKKGPFDIILLHDVLDHTVGKTPVELLRSLRSVLSSEGKVYVRNHPWCSRHGAHLYSQINKAFLHLVMDETELARFGGFVPDFTHKITQPLEVYRQWIKDADYKICTETPILEPVESYFYDLGFIRDRLVSKWDGDELTMKSSMEINLVEYILEPINSNQKII